MNERLPRITIFLFCEKRFLVEKEKKIALKVHERERERERERESKTFSASD
jgi:hypothetical protein